MQLENQRSVAVLALLLALGAASLWSCTSHRVEEARPSAMTSYVVLADRGQPIARAITSDKQCPQLWIDDVAQPMRIRAAPETAAARPGQAKPSEFSQLVCEAPLPVGARTARIADHLLAPLSAEPKKIVVLGDTGCRIKTSENAFQACDDPGQWPFAAIADAAAREGPDLVIHVGDYHYRESECPADRACAHSVWGYGWDAWSADFFVPGKRLLAVAPWVVVRGNHEECARAGQGWFRLLDSRPFTAGRSCDDARNDADADFSEPYAIPLGSDWQLIVFDSALASRALDLQRAADVHLLARYQENMQAVNTLAAAPGVHSIFVSHHPVLGFTVGRSGVRFGNPTLLAAMKSINGTRYFPPGIEASLHGHVHSFQVVNFSSAHPPTLVAGHGGDDLDADLSGSVAASYASAPDVRVDSMAHSRGFGYLLLERDGQGWTVLARRSDGSTLTVCTLRNAQLACGPGVLSAHPGARDPAEGG